MNFTFSSTKPNAYDTRRIAKGKLLQIENGNELAVNVGGTVSISSTDNQPYDTPVVTVQKILQQIG